MVYYPALSALQYPLCPEGLSDGPTLRPYRAENAACVGISLLRPGLSRVLAASADKHVEGLFKVYGLLQRADGGDEKGPDDRVVSRRQPGHHAGVHATLVGLGLLPASVVAGLPWRTISPEATFYFGGAVGIFSALGMPRIPIPKNKSLSVLPPPGDPCGTGSTAIDIPPV